jgi:hypothetical protein
MLLKPSDDGYSLLCSKKQPPRHTWFQITYLSLKGLCHKMNIFLRLKKKIGTLCTCAEFLGGFQ